MNELILNQKKIPRYKWRYGLRSSAATGCGWIAVYNALTLMGYRVEPEALIRCFERQLPLIHGNFGTTLFGPAICLRQMGFSVKLWSCRSKFDRAAREADVSIIFYRWHKGWRFGAHFAALNWQEGRFVGYNTYSNSVGPDPYGRSLEEFLKKRKYFTPVLITVKDKRRRGKT